MTDADHIFLDEKLSPIDKLKALLKAPPKDPGDRIGWLGDILERPLERVVQERFAADQRLYYDEFQVDENLAEGSRLLDICLVQRREILDLEALAVMTALDICRARQTLHLDLGLERFRLIAELAAGDIPTDEPLRILKEKFDLQMAAIRERTRLHNLNGNALNYGERIATLRRIYADNLYLAFERLVAVWRGSAITYRIFTEQPTVEAGKGRMLDYLVNWTREAINKVEASARHERVFDVQLYLVRGGLQSDGHFATFLRRKTGGAYHGTFEVNLTDLEQPRGVIIPGMITPETAVRILGVDVAIVFKEDGGWTSTATKLKDAIGKTGYATAAAAAHLHDFIEAHLRRAREDSTFRITLVSPLTTTSLPQLHRIGNAPAWTGAASRNTLRPMDAGRLRNRNPIGAWEIYIDSGVSGTDADELFNEREESGPASGPLSQIEDVVLVFRLAAR